MLDVFIDALLDSLKVLGVVFVVYILLSFIESKISHKLEHNKQLSPLLGATFGLIPQCGFSVVAADLYIKEHITMGTLVAVFIACSDEALPIMLSDFSKAYMILPLLAIKFVLGFTIGYLIDLVIRRNKEKQIVKEHFEHCEHEEEIHIGCCHHEIDNEKESKVKAHLLHPLIHSLKIFAYIFVINMLFGTIIYFVGEENIEAFLSASKYFGPLLSTTIGLIPNCASSVIITELYVMDKISFGTAISGLIINAGLGMVVLLKNKKCLKNALIILGILILVSVATGYITCLIAGF